MEIQQNEHENEHGDDIVGDEHPDNIDDGESNHDYHDDTEFSVNIDFEMSRFEGLAWRTTVPRCQHMKSMQQTCM